MSKVLIRYDTHEYIDLDGGLGEAIQLLQTLANKYGDDAELNIEEDYGSVKVFLYGTRLETDGELESRLKSEARAKENREARDRMDYERLKKMFQSPKE